jgi:predicted hydrolase (HD superfamily)
VYTRGLTIEVPVTVDEARALMHEWTPSPALRVHMECVAACMGAYADKWAPDERERWVVCGLLHDADYEKHPDEHPRVVINYLRERKLVDDEVLDAIFGHTNYPDAPPRTSRMAKTLFAVDELAGFVVACAKVRPTGISDMEPSSVKKKLKDKAFAAAVNRQDIRNGIAEVGVDETEHIRTCIDAIRAERERLGL